MGQLRKRKKKTQNIGSIREKWSWETGFVVTNADALFSSCTTSREDPGLGNPMFVFPRSHTH